MAENLAAGLAARSLAGNAATGEREAATAGTGTMPKVAANACFACSFSRRTVRGVLLAERAGNAP
jgi:hypothetical protein